MFLVKSMGGGKVVEGITKLKTAMNNNEPIARAASGSLTAGIVSIFSENEQRGCAWEHFSKQRLWKPKRQTSARHLNTQKDEKTMPRIYGNINTSSL